MLIIREEQHADYDQIYQLVQAAFASAERSDGTEQDLVVQLRQTDAYIPALALVAQEGETLCGHILFTRITLRDTPALIVAPLAIAPAFQRKGLGTQLLQEGHRIARALGYEYCILFGSAHYYPRVGYRPAHTFGLYSPLEVPPENFMAIHLQGATDHFGHLLVEDLNKFA